MNALLKIILSNYDTQNKELFSKAKLLLGTTLFVIISLLLIIAYTKFLAGMDNSVISIEIAGFSVMLIALVMLIKGHYGFAVHTILITGFTIVWIILFMKPDISPVMKLDTIVYVVGLLAVMPLMFFKNRKPMVAYFVINLVLFLIFNFYLSKISQLTLNEHLDYFFDNLIVMCFVFFISYNLFSIYQQTLNTLNTELAERKKTEKALLESEKKLSIHLQNTPVGAISMDLNFKITGWNPAAGKIFGYQTEEVIGQSISNLIVPYDLKHDVESVFSELMAGQGGKRNVNENITKSGKRIMCDWYNSILSKSFRVSCQVFCIL